MSPELVFLLVIILMGVAAGPFYMRMLAHGAKPDPWWRGRRDGALKVGVALLVVGVVTYLIGTVGAITLAWVFLVSAAFLLSIAATCHLALRGDEERRAKSEERAASGDAREGAGADQAS